MKNIIITFLLTLLIGFSTSLVSYAYFTNKIEINNDLQITTGTFQVEVGDGINTSLMPGEYSNYNYFDIKNKGSLNQNAIIRFININKDLNQIEKSIFYELQIKSESGFTTVLYASLDQLNDMNIKYKIDSGEQISFRSKIILSEDIDSQYYEQYINLRLKVSSYQVNDTF